MGNAKVISSVPFLDFKRTYYDLKIDLDAACREVLESGHYILGPKVTAFEKAFADFCGAKYCIGVGNGLEAITLTLQAWGIGGGDEVICATNSFVATALGVSRANATPVLVEADSRTYNIDPKAIELAITEKTKAIALTHLYGLPAEMDEILSLAKKYNLKVLEDAAQAHGAEYKGTKVGGIGDAATFSFYPTKNMGAFGDAGAITTNDEMVAEHLKKMRSYGSLIKYHHEFLGTNSRLDEIQASLLLTKIGRIEAWNQRRRDLANIYFRELANIEGLVLPHVPSGLSPIWHAFVILVTNGRRDGLCKFFEEKNVGYNVHYPVPIHAQKCYADLPSAKNNFPIADEQAGQLLSLPCDPYHTEEEILFVCDKIKEFFAKN